MHEQLEKWGEALLRGDLSLHELPPAVAMFYHLGYLEARKQNEARIRDLEHQCDRLYLAAAHPRERAELLQSRLDQHFEREANLDLNTSATAFAA